MSKVAYYPGCALEGSGGPYDRSTRALVDALGLKMIELDDWNCCGAMEVKNIHPMLQTYMSARNMAIASEKMGCHTVMAPCNGCYHNLKKAEYECATSSEAMDTVQSLAKKADDPVYKGDVRTIHLLEWLMEELGPEGLKARLKNSLKGMKIANYYGCMYTRPRQIFPEKDQGPGSESSHAPHFMDDLLAAAGAVNVEYPLKTACCGGAHTLSDSGHLDPARAQPAASGRGERRRGDRHRVPDLPLRSRDAPDPRRDRVRDQDRRQGALLHAAARPRARALGTQARDPREHLGLARFPAREGGDLAGEGRRAVGNG
ncbi:MAG: heterodisulfide reductase-related iron-sulfur binding cluster [Burkholderiales bacterium]|nr:heterodisulfide reductase-related iron-sulfur binding cluster [Burkholderiales bacterium]